MKGLSHILHKNLSAIPNSAVVEGTNNKNRKAFRRAYGFKSQENRDKIIYLVAVGLNLPPEC
jgi:hypothetical protein